MFYKKHQQWQISYQHQLSRLDWLDPPDPLSLRLQFLMYHPICILICLSWLCSLAPPTSSPCVLCGIKVWIRQMDRALDRSERSMLPDWLRRSVQTDGHVTADLV